MFRSPFLKILTGLAGLAAVAGISLQNDKVRGFVADARVQLAPEVKPEAKPQPQPYERVVAEGRIVAYPGAEVTIGAESPGRIVTLPVDEKSQVHRGDTIAELNTEDLVAARAEAEARIAESEAEIHFHELELRREEALLTRLAGTTQRRDTERRALDVARAQKKAALAQRDRHTALIGKMRIVSPIDGVVTARHSHPGEILKESDRVVTICDLSRIRVEAEVDEFDTSHVTLGAKVIITAEGYDGRSWEGEVEEIPDSVVGRKLRPDDPGKPVDSRVLAVKIAFKGEKPPLKIGQRVEIEIRHP